MAALQQLAEAVRTHLVEEFPEIRLSGATNLKQLAEEPASIPESALPALIISADSGDYTKDGLTREVFLNVMLVDQFRMSTESRQVSVWQAFERLQSRFTISGTPIGDAICLPLHFEAVKADVNHASYLLKLKIIHPAEQQSNQSGL